MAWFSKAFRSIHLWLFIATFLSISFSGSLLTKSFDSSNFLTVLNGWPFAGSLMFILLSHEMGHFFAARRWGVRTSLPYFIPFPFTPLGTLGAVILMKDNAPNRNALFDIGAAGPWAGMLAIAVLRLTTNVAGPSDFITAQLDYGIFIGLIVTLINLFPVGILDGGHILYSVRSGDYIKFMVVMLVGTVAYIIFFQNFSRIITLVIMILISGFRHLPTLNDNMPLSSLRKFFVGLTLILYVALLINVF